MIKKYKNFKEADIHWDFYLQKDIYIAGNIKNAEGMI